MALEKNGTKRPSWMKVASMFAGKLKRSPGFSAKRELEKQERKKAARLKRTKGTQEENMPYGPGTYGRKRGRPPKRNKKKKK